MSGKADNKKGKLMNGFSFNCYSCYCKLNQTLSGVYHAHIGRYCYISGKEKKGKESFEMGSISWLDFSRRCSSLPGNMNLMVIRATSGLHISMFVLYPNKFLRCLDVLCPKAELRPFSSFELYFFS